MKQHVPYASTAVANSRRGKNAAHMHDKLGSNLSGPSMASMTRSAVDLSRLFVRLRWWLIQIPLARSMAASLQTGASRNRCTSSSTDSNPPSPACQRTAECSTCGHCLAVQYAGLRLRRTPRSPGRGGEKGKGGLQYRLHLSHAAGIISISL